jgi:hypothetical protein
VRKFGPSRLGLFGSLGLAAAGVLGFALCLLVHTPSLAPVAGVSFLAAVGGALGAVLFGSSIGQRGSPPATLTADADGLLLGGKRVATRQQIKSALVYEREGSTRVRVVRRGPRPPMELAVGDTAEGVRVLEGLGLDAGHTVARFAASAPSWRHWKWRWLLAAIGPLLFGFGTALLGAAGPRSLAPAGLTLLVPLMMLLVAQLVIPGRVTVGADGILVRWLWQQKFIPLADIDFVEQSDAGAMWTVVPMRLLIHLKSGRIEEVLVGTTRSTLSGRRMYDAAALQQRSTMLAERIREAQDAADKGKVEDAALALPPRGEKPIAEWLGELRELLNRDTYRRQAAPAIHDLWKLVEDATHDAPVRAAAAASLGPTLDDAGRQRLRVVAEATAAPRLRIALEAVAEKDDRRLSDALAELTPEREAAEREV